MNPATAARARWQRQVRTRPYREGETFATGGGIAAAWLEAAREALPPGGGHLDLGCGEGRMTFALASRWAGGGWSVGADRDPAALAAARERARCENLSGARFVQMDVEREEYAPRLEGGRPGLITAHLCMGAGIVERAARALPPGMVFAFCALHPEQWKESGRSSAFAMSEGEIERALAGNGLEPFLLRFEKDVIEFSAPSDALRGYFKNGEAAGKWRADGRWDGIRRYFEESGRSFTARAQVMGAARKVSP